MGRDFFYGIHQVDAIVELMGTGAEAAQLIGNGKNGVATILFSEGRLATMNCMSEHGVFHWRACTEKGVICAQNKMGPDPYVRSVRSIYAMIQKGEVPWSRERMLAPIAILEALQKSLKTGKLESVSPL